VKPNPKIEPAGVNCTSHRPAATPPELLQAHLTLDRQVVDALRTNKTPVVPA
jgi:hypothetical protein